MSSTDFTVLTNLSIPGTVTFNLPAGVDKTIYVVGDGGGIAQTYNITIVPNSGTINGASTYVIKNNYGAVALQYSSAAGEWKIINRYFTKIDAANEVFGIVSPANGGTGVANNAAATITRSGNHALTLTTTNTTSLTLPTSGTVTTTANKLSDFASTTSAELRGVISDETGSGSAVFGTGPTIGSPTISDYALLTETSTPSTPSSGKLAYYAKSDHKIYTKDSNGNEVAVGTGSGGEVNYIKNPDFESNSTSGWATYADAAATTPANGTGGSPNSTLTATASNPLRGVYSGLFTKGSANRQGEGFSYDFTIDIADKSQPIAITWNGSASANYTGSTGSEYLSVFVYDVTNSQLIYPASTVVAPGASTGKTFFVATTSTSYRLIFHVAGTGTSSWTYMVDNVQVGPQSLAVGSAVTDWISYTPTTQGFGTVSNMNASYKIDGSSIHLQVRFTGGTPTASEAQIGLPSGYTVGSTSGLVVGNGYRDNTTGSTYKRYGILATATNAYVQVTKDDYTGTSSPFSPMLGNAVIGTSEVFGFEAEVHVSQLSSNIVIADRAVETYASNSSTNDGDDSTSFAYGASGSQFVNFGGLRAKRVRYQTSITATDTHVFEHTSDAGVTWTPLGQNGSSIQMRTVQNTNGYGVYWVPVNSTDIDVFFSSYRNSETSSFGGAGTNWSGIAASNTYRWRMRKISGGSSIGYPISTANFRGVVDGSVAGSGVPGEIIEASVVKTSAVSLTTATAATITSITLTPGCWDLYGIVGFDCASGTSVNTQHQAISLTNNALPGAATLAVPTSGEVRGEFVQTTANGITDRTYNLGPARVNITTSTTYYLIGYSDFSISTAKAYGYIRGERKR